jgi:3-phenylpropionate/trans-cinnamate dioxygenase ferredoxin subunit
MTRVQIGLAGDVPPGTMRGMKAGEKAVLVSNISGNFHAMGDRCTHRGCPLSRGKMEGEVVTCPCHGAQINLKTGAVVKGPAEEAEQVYPVTVEGDRIWVEV